MDKKLIGTFVRVASKEMPDEDYALIWLPELNEVKAKEKAIRIYGELRNEFDAYPCYTKEDITAIYNKWIDEHHLCLSEDEEELILEDIVGK